MWLLKWLPDSLFYIMFFVGIIGTAVVSNIALIPYKSLLKAAFVGCLFISTYMIGAIANNDSWKKQVQELELKLAEAKVESVQTNTKIVEKLITRTQVIRERGKDITSYVDREIIKYDNTCVIPKEFIEIHNRAAEVPK